MIQARPGKAVISQIHAPTRFVSENLRECKLRFCSGTPRSGKTFCFQVIYGRNAGFARYNYAMTDTRKEVRQGWLSVPRKQEGDRLDPHVYERGVNGLTVEEAVGRATPRVMGILGRSDESYSEFERQLVRQTIRAALISQVSRANLYRIAGILVADRRDEGAHLGASLALAYVAALREAFLGGISVGEQVVTIEGPGEVRYVSGSGGHVVVRLAGNREVWLPQAGISRLFGEDLREEGTGLRAS